MFEFHQDKLTYFNHQYQNAKAYVIPFIQHKIKDFNGKKVLEIGCAEGGVLKAFVDAGAIGTGVELVKERHELASAFLKEYIQQNRIQLIQKNIYDTDFINAYKNYFDIIILKDVIEHIFDQKKLLLEMQQYLKTDGLIYFGFPPWQMPFGGHQQICHSKLLSLMPYFHLLPSVLYKFILQIFGENKAVIQELLEIKQTGISIERFEKIIKETNYQICKKDWFLINPIYEYKFNLKPRLQFNLIRKIPIIRNFFTTCVYYLIEIKK